MVNMVLRTVIISSHQNLKMDKNRDFHSLIRFSLHLVFSTEPLAEQTAVFSTIGHSKTLEIIKLYLLLL